MKLINNIYILSTILLFIVNCRMRPYWHEVPSPVKDSENNFLYLYLPSEFEDGVEKIQINEYIISILQEETNSFLKRRILINPSRELNTFTLWLGDLHKRFPTGCEIVIPVSKGKHLYQINVSTYSFVFKTALVADVDLDVSKSIWMDFYSSEKVANPTNDPRYGDGNLLKNRIKLRYSIENSFKESRHLKCDLRQSY
ncbi:hypothetical protein EHQ53_08635 [Leptospira langatensis]|uniref:Uncharacterized protein n=1 Tax=Leptospira langatensis TaxID=2484983 RepID=A0A5F1ZUY5_9LEPT|nr:hypothetical protein [Leptospira langatensis]TGK01304.1 hypothetical protein EHO57_10235 [Leptospira langatensis]TGL42244.1 hypothetical protein EHQ53_08635 [Leptospira langatensis]